MGEIKKLLKDKSDSVEELEKKFNEEQETNTQKSEECVKLQSEVETLKNKEQLVQNTEVCV